MVWGEGENVYQRNKMKSQKIDPHICEQLIYNKTTKVIWWTKNGLFNKWCLEKWISTCTNINCNPYIVPYTKLNSKYIINLNIKAKTVKLYQKTQEKVLVTLD